MILQPVPRLRWRVFAVWIGFGVESMVASQVNRLVRPVPPGELIDNLNFENLFVPAPDVAEWMKQTFIAEGSPICNPDHQHLQEADIAVLWTNVANSKQMRTIVGTAEIPMVQGSKWTKARVEWHLMQMFGSLPDFLITLHAAFCHQASDATFLALCEHECYHCGQALDDLGLPKFKRSGEPVFGMRGHDAEEFIGVVRRYGMGAVDSRVRLLIEAAQDLPEVAVADITSVCGTCR